MKDYELSFAEPKNRNVDILLASVLIPSYNSPDLFKAVDSVLQQTYPNMELILVDDASSCFDSEKVEAYIMRNSAPNLTSVKVVENPKNLGVVGTMNRAFSLSKGEIIFSLASDDCFYDEQVIEDWVKEFLSTKCSVITAKRRNYDEKLEVGMEVLPSKLQAHWIRQCTPEQLFDRISEENFILGCCTAYTREILTRQGGFNPKYRGIDDLPFILEYLRFGEKIGFFDRIVIKYRGGGISSIKNFNLEYEQESDSIFLQEVIPYAKNPKRAKRRYRMWKRRRKIFCRYHFLMKKHQHFAWIYKIKMRLLTPVYTTKRLIHKYVIERILL